MHLENYTQHHSVESFLEAAQQVLTGVAGGLTDPFQVVIVAGRPGSGKSHLEKQATEKRSEVIYVDAVQGSTIDPSTIRQAIGGTIVLDDVCRFDRIEVANALEEVARYARASESRSLVVLVVQEPKDLARLVDKLPKTVVLIEVEYPHQLSIVVGSRESATASEPGDRMTQLAIVGEGAEQMFTALTGTVARY